MFANPLGLLALLGVSAVLGLHLYRRRFRPRTVSALFLWVDEDDLPAPGRRRERLRSSASLWLELTAALFLGLAFAGPRGCVAAEVPHLVVVLDASASMDATGPGGSTREAAAAVVRARLDALGDAARATLITTGRRPAVLAGPAAPSAEARDALAGFAPGALRHDPGPALVLAREVAGADRVLFVSDALPADPSSVPRGVELVSVGEPVPNAGIVHAVRTREREDGAVVERALVTVQAFTGAEITRTLVVEGPSRELARRQVTLAPDAREHLTFPLPEGFPPVRVRLLGDDALAVDDAVDLAPEPTRVVPLGTTLDLATARSLGLAAGEAPLARLVDALAETVAVPPEQARLLLGAPLGTAPGTWALRLPLAEAGARGDAAKDSPQATERRDLVGPFLVDRRHPLLSGVTLEGLVWSIDPDLSLPGTPLVSAGDLPILTEVFTGEGRTLWLNLDPARSTLARSPDWAILLSNLVEARRAALPGARATNVAVGEDFVLQGQAPGDYVATQVEHGNRLETRAAGGVVTFETVPVPGLYEVRRGPDGRGEVVARFAAQFQDGSESDLRRRAAGKLGTEAATARVAGEANPLVALAAVLVLAVLLADWWWLSRTRHGASPARASDATASVGPAPPAGEAAP